MIERIGDRDEAAVDRGGARGRHLLPHDDLREAREAALAAAQRRPPGALEDTARSADRARSAPRCRARGRIRYGYAWSSRSSWPGLTRPSSHLMSESVSVRMDARVKPAHDESDETTRLPFRAEPERLPASRSCALGADRFRDGARNGRALPAAHRGHRSRRAAGRNSRRRSTKTSPGSASRGKSRCGASPSISTPTSRRSRSWRRRAWSIRASRAAARSRGYVAERRTVPWPRDPDGAPLYPGTAKQLARRGARSAACGGRALCAAARHERRGRAHRRAHLGRDRRRSEAGSRDADGAAGDLGRRRARPQGHADQLSPLGRGGRRRCRA